MIKIKHSQCSETRHAHWGALLTIMLPAAVQLKMVGKTHKQTGRQLACLQHHKKFYTLKMSLSCEVSSWSYSPFDK